MIASVYVTRTELKVDTLNLRFEGEFEVGKTLRIRPCLVVEESTSQCPRISGTPIKDGPSTRYRNESDFRLRFLTNYSRFLR